MTTKGDILVAVSDYAEERFGQHSFFRGTDHIPASGSVISPEDISCIVDAALNGWYTEHKVCASFARELKKAVGADHITLCNSGSSASLLAVTAVSELDSRPYVLTCATGFPTTVSPIYQNNKIPIYIDINPRTLSPNLDDVQRALLQYGDKICGAIFAHTLGFPFDEWRVFEMLDGKWFIVDNCDAFGAELVYESDYKGVYPVGVFANLFTCSFFPAHHITSGEGGMVATDDPELHKIVESLSNWGRDCFCAPGQSNTCGKRFEPEYPDLPDAWDHKYTFTRLGYNLKMTDLQAALGLSQLRRLDAFVSARQNNFYYLLENLSKYSRYLDFITIPSYSKPSPFGFPILVRKDAPFAAKDLIAHLEDHKVHTRRVFGGNLLRQPAFSGLTHVKIGNLEGSNRVMEDGLWIGVQPALTKDHLDYVLDVFEEFFEGG